MQNEAYQPPAYTTMYSRLGASSASSIYSDNEDFGVFGPNLERANRINSVVLPDSDYKSSLASPSSTQNRQHTAVLSNGHPFVPLVFASKTANLKDGFPNVYFSQQMRSHDVSMNEWQNLLTALQAAAVGQISRLVVNTSLNESIGYFSPQSPNTGGYILGAHHDRFGGCRRQRCSRDRKSGPLRQIVAAGIQRVTQREDRSQQRYLQRAAADEQIKLKQVVESWNTMFFHPRDMHLCMVFAAEVRAEYDQLCRGRCATLVQSQAEEDGTDSLNKARLVISTWSQS